MSFLKLLKLEFEACRSDQFPFSIYIVLYIVDGLFIEPLVIIIIIQVLIVIVVRHDRLASLLKAYYHISFIFRRRSRPDHRNRIGRCNYARIAFFALAAIGSASVKALKVISRAYRLLPSASCPRWRENQTAASNLLLGDRRVKT